MSNSLEHKKCLLAEKLFALIVVFLFIIIIRFIFIHNFVQSEYYFKYIFNDINTYLNS